MKFITVHPVTIGTLLVFVGIVDRITKNTALSGQYFSLFTHTQLNNRFLFFFEKSPSLQAVLVCGVVVFCGVLIWWSYEKRSAALLLATLAILGGALSNFWDQYRYGGAIDWIAIPGFTVFNIADILICVGIFIAGVILFLRNTKPL